MSQPSGDSRRSSIRPSWCPWNGAWLADRGITNAVELNWGQSIKIKGLTVVCTPASTARGARLSIRAAGSGLRGQCWAPSASISREIRLLFPLQGNRRRAGTLRPGALPIGSYTPRSMPALSYLARRSAPGLDRPAGGTVHWHPLGHLRLAREPYDEPAQTHCSGGGAERAGSGSRVDTQAG